MTTLILEDLEGLVPRLWTARELQFPPSPTGSDDRWPRKTLRPVRSEGLLNKEERLLYRLSLLAMLD